jgi:excisionase family DNA binding protein
VRESCEIRPRGALFVVADRGAPGFGTAPGFTTFMSVNVAPCTLLTRQELADVLRVNVRTVDRLQRRGLIAPVQLVRGGRVRFRHDDVERLLTPETRDPLPARPDELDWR